MERALPSAMRSGTRFSLKKFRISLPSAGSDSTWQSPPLCRVSPDLTLGKDFFIFYFFLKTHCSFSFRRVPNLRHSAKFNGGNPGWRSAIFAECHSLPSARHSAKAFLPSVFTLPSVWHSAKSSLPSVCSLLSVRRFTLGKEALCRVPDFRHSAKIRFSVVM